MSVRPEAAVFPDLWGKPAGWKGTENPTLPTQGQCIPLPSGTPSQEGIKYKYCCWQGLDRSGKVLRPPLFPPAPQPVQREGKHRGLSRDGFLYIIMTWMADPNFCLLSRVHHFHRSLPFSFSHHHIFPHQLLLTLSTSISSFTQPQPHKPRPSHLVFI